MPLVQVDRNGRIVLPAEFRRALGVKAGDYLVIDIEGGRVELMTPAQAMWEIQEEVLKHVPPGVSLVDELIEERRQEAAREDEELEELRRART
jgi:AbrB family looped-hinge helix DNA binding protein